MCIPTYTNIIFYRCIMSNFSKLKNNFTIFQNIKGKKEIQGVFEDFKDQHTTRIDLEVKEFIRVTPW